MTQLGRMTTWAGMQTFNMPSLNSEFDNIINAWNNTDNGTNAWNYVNVTLLSQYAYGSTLQFISSNGLLNSNIKYTINNFTIIGDGTNGLNLFGNGGNISLGETSGSYGGGVKVVFIPNASALPSTNPAGGGILYVDSGALKWRGSSGTVTTLGAA